MKQSFILSSIVLIALACPAFSAGSDQLIPPETATAGRCAITPAVGAISYPGALKIPHTNDLVRPTGKPDDTGGQMVYFMGKVVDQNCNPLSDVVVELWQPDPYSTFKIPSNSDMANPNAMFAGAGKTYTGIDGTFSFRTLFPGTLTICQRRNARGKCISSLERAPFYNIRISSKALRSNTVSMGTFFENDRRNPTDPVYRKLSDVGKGQLTMKVLPSDAGDYASGMRTYIELVVPTKPHWHGY